jgi:hypothetical protein
MCVAHNRREIVSGNKREKDMNWHGERPAFLGQDRGNPHIKREI